MAKLDHFLDHLAGTRKNPQSKRSCGFYGCLVALQGFEPRTCGL